MLISRKLMRLVSLLKKLYLNLNVVRLVNNKWGFAKCRSCKRYTLASGTKDKPWEKKSKISPKRFSKACLWKKIDYLFENCGDLLAFFLPGFLRSTTLESRVRSPIGLRIALKDGSNSTRALVIPCLSASA